MPQAPFVPGTVISSAAVNSDLSDIATALTGSIAANGVTTITGALKSNVTTSPAYSSSTDTTTGFGSSTPGEADIWVSGSIIVATTAAGSTVNGSLTVTGNATFDGNLVVNGSFSFGGTSAVTIPDGTTAQRPATPVQSDIRFNNTLNTFEGYDGTEWVPMSNITTAFTITASVASNLLTVSILNAKTGAAPTVADPIAMTFRDATLANGDPVTVVVNAALTINTNGVGASLGSSNGVPFRFWLVAFNNAGTVQLGLINCSIPGQIFPLNEAALHSSAGISSAATSAGVYYTPNGVTVSNAAIKILGYLDYGSGLTTAGTYATTPTAIEPFGPGVYKPGEVVQMVYATATTGTTNSTATKTQTNTTASITPSSTINQILARATGNMIGAGSGNNLSVAQLSRGATPILFGTLSGTFDNEIVPVTLEGLDNPETISSIAYYVYIWLTTAGGTMQWIGSQGGSNPINTQSTMLLQEIMG